MRHLPRSLGAPDLGHSLAGAEAVGLAWIVLPAFIRSGASPAILPIASLTSLVVYDRPNSSAIRESAGPLSGWLRVMAGASANT